MIPMDFLLMSQKNILSEKKINLDENKYEDIVLNSKSKQKNTWVGSGENPKDTHFINLKQKIKKTMFLGYNQTNSKCTLKHIFHNRNEVKNVEKNNKNIILIFDKTPFYAEAGDKLEILENSIPLKKNLLLELMIHRKLTVIFFYIF